MIGADCGFFIRHQAAVAAAMNVPVVLSGLLLVPTLLRELPRAAKLAVITADSTHCGKDLLGVDDPADRRGWLSVASKAESCCETNWCGRQFRPMALISRKRSACIARLRAAHPEIAAILFECTAFPLVTPKIHRSTGLPVYDITDLYRLTLASVS